ncbi:MAG TPA: DEAD/DEAH box helicase, partial [Phycisphaerales bacterium]|nr:DEAD/DEAH box helicase [Phycisphaerales bacterium]
MHEGHRGLARLEGWFASRGWEPHAFQREAWCAFLSGKSGLIHVPTGAGKTYAAYGGPLAEMLGEEGFGASRDRGQDGGARAVDEGTLESRRMLLSQGRLERGAGREIGRPALLRAAEEGTRWEGVKAARQRGSESVMPAPLRAAEQGTQQGTQLQGAGAHEGARGIRVIYVTPLRAVSRDIEKALTLPVLELGLGVRVESRTGDTSSSARARQKEELPQVLVTTPESLTLMMTWEDAHERFRGLRAVIVDEWHELLSTKRGTQTELALARLRGFAAGMRTWALSATLENLGEAARAVTGRGGVVRAAQEDDVEAGSLPRSEQRSRAPADEERGTRVEGH